MFIIILFNIAICRFVSKCRRNNILGHFITINKFKITLYGKFGQHIVVVIIDFGLSKNKTFRFQVEPDVFRVYAPVRVFIERRFSALQIPLLYFGNQFFIQILLLFPKAPPQSKSI